MSTQAFIQKPSKVTRAHDRLQDAISRLEYALANTPPRLSQTSGPEDTVRVNLLEQEVERLTQENAALKRINEQVSTRLDGAIERLKKILGD